MKNKSKKIMGTSKTDRLNSDYRELVVRRLVDSKEVDFSIAHRANRMFIDWLYE